MSKIVIYSFIYLAGVLISAFGQIILKRSSSKHYEKRMQEYLNFPVISAYSIFVISTLCSIYAYKVIPLSLGPILGASEYLFVAFLSRGLLAETIGKRKAFGLALIIAGIVVYAL